MSKTQSRNLTNICKHVSRVMGADKRAATIILEIQKWETNSGPEWTLERLKSLKRSVIAYVSNDTMQINKQFPIDKSLWIKAKANGWPKGPLGSLIEETLKSKTFTSRKLGKLLSILETGKAFKRPEVTETQRKKFLEAIQGIPIREDIYDYSYKAGKTCCKALASRFSHSFIRVYPKYHNFSFAGLNSAKPTVSFKSKDMKNIHPWLFSFIEGTAQRGPWTNILKSMGIPTKIGPKPLFGGKITVLQEGGLKARVIAVPVACAQVAFKPLHDTMNTLLRNHPKDCTHNQNKGIAWGSKKLKEGKNLHAVDLSSATDNFPLGFQAAVLDHLGYQYTEEFKQFCQMSFGTKGAILKYSKGQPMGLYGSFALFAFSHHVLLGHIERKLGVRDTYQILGDDIIISDDQVHRDYLSRMKLLGVPISHHKCLTSDLFTEFAGKLVSPLSQVDVAKAPHLSNGMINIDQFMNYCKVTGSTKASLSGVPKKYREFAKRYVALPEMFGGLGINPDGRSVEERLVAFEKSKASSFPISEDLSSSLIFTTALSSGNDHVKRVCSFVNDQLTHFHQEIDEQLQQFGLPIKGSPALKRSVLAQIGDSLSRDIPLSYVGTIAKNSTTTSVYSQWADSCISAAMSVEKRFDRLSKEDLDNLIQDYSSRDVSGSNVIKRHDCHMSM